MLGLSPQSKRYSIGLRPRIFYWTGKARSGCGWLLQSESL